MRRLQALPICWCLMLGLSQPSAAESLKETYQQALKNDHTFKAAQAQYDAGKQNKYVARAGLLPQVEGTASYTDSQAESTQGQPTSELDPQRQFVGSIDLTRETYGLSLNQAIVNISAWHNYKRGVSLSDAAEAQFRTAELSLIVRATEAYLGVLQAADNLETSRAEENALSHQLQQTTQRFEVGLTAITEVHENQAAFDSATANRLIAEGQLAIAFEALEVITGASYASLSPLKKSIPVVNPDPLSREEWVQFALENNYNLKAASFNAKAAKQLAKARRADHLPTLGGQVSFSNTKQNFADPQADDIEDESTSITLSLNVPLYSGGGTSASRRQAAYSAIQAREEFNQNQRDVIQNTRAEHLRVVTGVATVKARSQAITSSQSALDATQAGYEVGTRDLVDVLNAQRNLYASQRDYFDALYDYVLSTLRLKQVAGTLTPLAVDQLDEWLDKNTSVKRQ